MDIPHPHARSGRATLGIACAIAVHAAALLGMGGMDDARGEAAPAPAECRDLAGKEISYSEAGALMLLAPGESPRRIAIVIGNDYPNPISPDGAVLPRPEGAVRELKNPTNDARAMAAVLAGFQFKVFCFLNISALVQEIILNVSTEIGKAATNGLTFYYFAGHGYTDGAETYTVGDGAKMPTAGIIQKYFSLNVKSIISFLRSRDARVIAIFDMCREKLPLPPDPSRRALGNEEQKSYIPLGPEKGMLIHYSTSPNEYANDLPAETHGLYARKFLELVPKDPGRPALSLLDSAVGPAVAETSASVPSGYIQEPYLVSSPDTEWDKVAIYEIMADAQFDSQMNILRGLEQLVDGNNTYNITYVCGSSKILRDSIIAGADRQPSSRFTATEVLNRIDKLYEKIAMKGTSCKNIVVAAAGTQILTIPPMVHKATSSTLPVKIAGSPSNAYEDAKRVTWVATSSAPLLLHTTGYGAAIVAQKGAIDLNKGFISSANLDVDWAKAGAATEDKSTSPVYVTPIEPEKVVPIFTKDQMVVKFEVSGGSILNLKTAREQMRTLRRTSSKSKYLLVPSPLPEWGDRLNQMRLRIQRVTTMLVEMEGQGFSPSQIVVPPLDRDAPIRLESLLSNEILVKIVSEDERKFAPFNVDATIAESGSGGGGTTIDSNTFKRFLETYQANTSHKAM